MKFATYRCGVCGSEHPDSTAFAHHHINAHPETWLAKRAKRELERLEKTHSATPK